MPPHPISPRFSRNRSGAAYPLKTAELLQARSHLSDSESFGWLILRVTQDAYRERAEYWFGSRLGFVSTLDKLSPELLQELTVALSKLAIATDGYNPSVDANDSGRSIMFWNDRNPLRVFVPSHPTPYQPPEGCRLAFDNIWSMVAEIHDSMA